MEKQKKAISPLCFLSNVGVICLLLGVSSCKKNEFWQKENKIVSTESMTSFAKKYFFKIVDIESNNIGDNIIVKTKTTILNESKIAVKKNTPVNNGRLSAISNIVDWGNSKVIMGNGKKYLFVTLKEQIKPFKNKDYEFFRQLVFANFENGEITMFIVEMLSEKGGSLGSSPFEVTKIATLGYLNDLRENLSSLNASIIFYNNRYERKKSYQIINGSYKNFRINFRSDLEINK